MKKKITSALSVIILTSSLFGAVSGCAINHSNGPEQIEETVDSVREAAIKELEEYPVYENYRRNEQEIIRGIIETAKSAFRTSESIEAIKYLLDFYKAKIDEVRTKDTFESWEQDDFLDYAQSLKDELKNYKNLKDYREAEKEMIQNYLNSAYEEIDAAHTKNELFNIIEKYKKLLDGVKTDNDYLEEEKDQVKLEDCNGTEQIKRFQEKGYSPLYADPNFKDGYVVTKPSYEKGESPYHDKHLRTYSSLNNPTWTIAQWASRYDILGDDEETGGVNVKREQWGLCNTYTSKGKMVDGTFIPGKVITANSIDGSIYLEANASVEYETHRTGTEPWVHLLLSQDFDNNLIYMKNLSSLVMEADFEIDYCRDMMGDAFDANKHCAQLCWYITVQNRNKQSKGFGQYIWFGIPLWDNRSEGKKASMYRAYDVGTDTLIYNPSSEVIYPNNNGNQPMIGQRITANVEVHSIIAEAFNYAKKEGYFSETEYDDLAIGGTNFGYEIPGTFDIGSTIHAINVFYKNK